MSWLWQESTALYPSLYSSKNLNSEQLQQLIRGRVLEAKRLRGRSRVLPYFWYKYRDGGFITAKDLKNSLATLYKSSAAGMVLWGSSNDINTKAKCEVFLDYVENTLGPIIAKYTKTERLAREHSDRESEELVQKFEIDEIEPNETNNESIEKIEAEEQSKEILENNAESRRNATDLILNIDSRQLTTESPDLKTELKQIVIEIPKIKTELRKDGTENTEAQIELKQIVTEIPKIKTELRKNGTENTEAQIELKQMVTEIPKIKTKLRKNGTENTEAQIELKQIVTEIPKINTELRKNATGNTEAQIELKQIVTEIPKINTELRKNATGNTEAQIELKQIVTEIPKIKTELRKNGTENTEAQIEFTQLTTKTPQAHIEPRYFVNNHSHERNKSREFVREIPKDTSVDVKKVIPQINNKNIKRESQSFQIKSKDMEKGIAKIQFEEPAKEDLRIKEYNIESDKKMYKNEAVNNGTQETQDLNIEKDDIKGPYFEESKKESNPNPDSEEIRKPSDKPKSTENESQTEVSTTTAQVIYEALQTILQ